MDLEMTHFQHKTHCSIKTADLNSPFPLKMNASFSSNETKTRIWQDMSKEKFLYLEEKIVKTEDEKKIIKRL